ncbi:oxidoreductase [Caballeronia sp. LZ062]|uniref:oxidoreductase n=1 Tax=unclassified Caballeronia TaxID=2646786 RepID=UPI00285B33EC|nr:MULTISPECIES: oxidoreductase [unclassified Caballeronia]MDR5855855.1 oxidoreductase [Caballeronia sp. LZ050]MDR5872359.1 oxidoreductase [Caballeronia sp. LZ062]
MSSALKVGLMGYGLAGATFHAPVIEHCGRAKVAAIATSQAERALADYPDARIVADFDALIALTDVPCVVIATPNDTHFDLAHRALSAGKHVVVDKPVTLSARDARTLADLAAERGLLFAPFHNRRWDGDFLTVRTLIESGRLGRITHYESHFDRFRPKVPQRWREEAARGGGLLFDLGPHLIDQALTLFGAPQTVTAFVKAHRDHAHAPDYVHLVLGYADKEVVLHASALAALEPPRFSIHGTRGSYVKTGLDVQEDQLRSGMRPGNPEFGKNPPGLLREVDGDHDLRHQFATRDGAYVEFYRALAASVTDGKPFPVTPQDAVDVMTVIELAMQSEREGRRVAFERLT